MIMTLVFFSINLSVAQPLPELREKANSSDIKERLDASWELFKLYRTSNKDSALYYAKLNHELSFQIGDSLSMVKSLNAIGYLFKENGNFIESINSYKKGLRIAKTNHYTDQVKFLLNNLAIVNSQYGRYDKSLEYHFQSLKIREDEGNLLDMSITYNNIGVVYDQIGDTEKALSFFLKSLNLKRENNINHDIDRNLINIGLAYTGLKKFDESIDAFKEVFEVCKGSCSEQILLEANSGIGVAYYMKGDLDNSKNHFNTSISLAEKQGENVYITVGYYYLAKINFDQGNTTQSLSFISEAEEAIRSTDSRNWKMDVDNLYSQLYESTGNYKEAYYFKNRYSALKDSIFSEELIKNIANIQLDFQEEQTQEIIATKDIQIWRRTQINLLLGGITLLISALLIILYRNIQLKKRANRKLAEANKIIEHQNKELTNVNSVLEDRVRDRTKELKKANIALKKSNEELDNFIYKTSHDIRGPLATLMGVCNIAQIDVKDNQALDYFEKLSITANRLNEILSKLLTINQINNTALQPENIDFNSLINDLIVEYKNHFGNPEMTIKVELPDNLHMVSDFELLRIIFGNLIANAVKFRDTSDRRESIINIKLESQNKWLDFTIEDNGIGISDIESERIFEVFSRGTDIADSSGIGLYLVKLAVEKLKGSVKHGKTEEGLTFFHVKIPK